MLSVHSAEVHMSRLLVTILIATLAPSTAAWVLVARTQHPAASSTSSAGDIRSINVDGRALITVMPDKATLTFIAEATGPTREAAQAAADARIEAALAALMKAGVDPIDLRSQAATLSPEYARDPRGQPLYLRVKHWTASRQLTVCTHDISTIASLQRAAAGAGMRDVGDVLLESSQVESLQVEARLQAARAARAKAEAMVQALGGQLGGPISVSEHVTSSPATYGQKNTSDDRTAGATGVVDGTFAAGKLSVTAQVSVSFEILRGT